MRRTSSLSMKPDLRAWSHTAVTVHSTTTTNSNKRFDGVSCNEARDVLLSYVSDSRFSRSAAYALIQYCPQPTASISADSRFREFAPSVLKARRLARESLDESQEASLDCESDARPN